VGEAHKARACSMGPRQDPPSALNSSAAIRTSDASPVATFALGTTGGVTKPACRGTSAEGATVALPLAPAWSERPSPTELSIKLELELSTARALNKLELRLTKARAQAQEPACSCATTSEHEQENPQPPPRLHSHTPPAPLPALPDRIGCATAHHTNHTTEGTR